MVVVAAGNEGRNNEFENEGYGTIGSPGNAPYVITVGRHEDPLHRFERRRRNCQLQLERADAARPCRQAGPGGAGANRIISLLAANSGLPAAHPDNAVPKSYFRPNAPDGDADARAYFRLSGTSMATPMVSGAAALLLEKEPSLDTRPGEGQVDENSLEELPGRRHGD